MLRMRYTYAGILLLLFLAACGSEQKTENDKVYREYEALVTQVEQDTVTPTEEVGLDSTWYQRTSVLQRKYDSLHNNINLTLDDLDPEQQQEVSKLEQRYQVAQNRINQKREDISKRYKMRQDLLGLKVNRDDLSSLDANELAPTYKHFVEKISENYKDYSFEDWQLIEGWWNALNNRKQQVTNELTTKDQAEIEKAGEQYLAIRNKTKIKQ